LNFWGSSVRLNQEMKAEKIKAMEETKMNPKMNSKRSQWGDLAQGLHVVVKKLM